RHGMRQVHLFAFHEGVVADLPQHVHGRLAHEVARHRGQVVLRLEMPVHPQDGTGAGLEVRSEALRFTHSLSSCCKSIDAPTWWRPSEARGLASPPRWPV